MGELSNSLKHGGLAILNLVGAKTVCSIPKLPTKKPQISPYEFGEKSAPTLSKLEQEVMNVLPDKVKKIKFESGQKVKIYESAGQEGGSIIVREATVHSNGLSSDARALRDHVGTLHTNLNLKDYLCRRNDPRTLEQLVKRTFFDKVKDVSELDRMIQYIKGEISTTIGGIERIKPNLEFNTFDGAVMSTSANGARRIQNGLWLKMSVPQELKSAFGEEIEVLFKVATGGAGGEASMLKVVTFYPLEGNLPGGMAWYDFLKDASLGRSCATSCSLDNTLFDDEEE